jgi:hypothetical protein
MFTKSHAERRILRSLHRPIVRPFSVSRSFSALSISIILLCAIAASANERSAKWPVPVFDSSYDTPAQRGVAGELKEAFADLQNHLCNRPNPVTENWKRRYSELVTRTVIAQHKVVWAAAGPVRAGSEGNELQGFYDLKREMKRFLEEEAGKNPNDAQELLAIRDRFETDTSNLQRAVDRVGYGGSILTVHAFRTVVRQLEKDLAGPVPAGLRLTNRLTTFRRNALKGLDRLEFEIYARTTAEIDRMRLRNGTQFIVYDMIAGDPDLHAAWVPSDYHAQVANAFFRTVGVTYRELGWKAPVFTNAPFNAGAALNLLGGCARSVVRVIYLPSREADAKRAEQLLKESGFDVAMRKIEGGNLVLPGKIFYFRNGTHQEASYLAKLVKDIEPVTPARPEGGTAHTEIDYALWIVEHNRSHPLHGTWMSDDSAGKWYIGVRTEGDRIAWDTLNYFGTSELGWWSTPRHNSVVEGDSV